MSSAQAIKTLKQCEVFAGRCYSTFGHRYIHKADPDHYAYPLDVRVDQLRCRIGNVSDAIEAASGTRQEPRRFMDASIKLLNTEFADFEEAWNAHNPDLPPVSDFGFDPVTYKPVYVQPLSKEERARKRTKTASGAVTTDIFRSGTPVTPLVKVYKSSGIQTTSAVYESSGTQIEVIQPSLKESQPTASKKRRLEQEPEVDEIKIKAESIDEDDDIPYFDQELVDMTGKKERYKRLAADRLALIHMLRKELGKANGRIESLEKEGLSD